MFALKFFSIKVWQLPEKRLLLSGARLASIKFSELGRRASLPSSEPETHGKTALLGKGT
jgi:hypothetical protein